MISDCWSNSLSLFLSFCFPPGMAEKSNKVFFSPNKIFAILHCYFHYFSFATTCLCCSICSWYKICVVSYINLLDWQSSSVGVVNAISYEWFGITIWSKWNETVLWGVFRGSLAVNDVATKVTSCSSKTGRCDLGKTNVPRTSTSCLRERCRCFTMNKKWINLWMEECFSLSLSAAIYQIDFCP